MSPVRIAIFLVVFAALLFGVHYYFWARLVRDPALPAAWSAGARWALVSLGALVLVGALSSRFVPRAVASPIMWVVYTWLGIMFLLLVLLGATDAVRGVLAIAHRVSSHAPVDPERRQLLSRLVAGGVALAALAVGGAGIFNVLRQVAVKRVRVELARLPVAASGYRIVQLTDIHIGPTIGREFLEQLVATVNALEPDLVAITGDLVDGSVAELGALVAPLAKLRAKDGVFFVTGNHEYYSGADAWLAHLSTLGVRTLRNEHVRIGDGGGGTDGFDLAGIDDFTAHAPGHGPDLPGALVGRDASRALVLLAHQPKAILEAEALGVGLQISGHTHAGQIFPFNFMVRLQQPYVAGLHTHGRAQIYVSAGTGYWGPPMRVGAPAEITEIELVSA